MRGGWLAFIVAALAVGSAGCAVLTIDVDVYKGALANHESVQTEQVAAMAMGAKPLIAELRLLLEQKECFQVLEELEDKKSTLARLKPSDSYPNIDLHCPAYSRVRTTARYLPDFDSARSRDTARVNGILSLYEDQEEAKGSQFVRGLEDRLRELLTRIKDGRAHVTLPVAKDKGAPTAGEKAAADKYVKDLSRDAIKWGLAPPCDKELDRTCPDVKENVRAVGLAWRAAREAWREAMRLLSSETNREKLSPQALDAVAWAAASLTSPSGLSRAATTGNREGLPALVLEQDKPFHELRERIPSLKDREAFKDTDADDATRIKTRRRVEQTIRGALSEMLQDRQVGRQLATQLLVAEAHAESLWPHKMPGGELKNPEENSEWFVSLYPSKYSLRTFEEASADAESNVTYLLTLTARYFDTGLGGGRLKDGIDKLTTEYLEANGKLLKNRGDIQYKLDRLLDALVGFGEKIAIIANLDILVRGTKPAGERNRFESYVRLLQAVGNSILSQVDALKQSGAHRERMEGAAKTEVFGIRNAEARAAAALKTITDELTARPNDFPNKANILRDLKAGQLGLTTLVTTIRTPLDTQRLKLAADASTAAAWATAASVIGRKDVQTLIEKDYGANPDQAKVSLVRTRLVTALGEWEGKARLSQADDGAEARRLQATTAVLGVATFLQDTGFPADAETPGEAVRKYEAIVKVIGRNRDETRSVERKTAAIVADLERWHATTNSLATGVAPLAIPPNIEQGGDQATAKDVLDVMLATLRYQHVAAVADDPDGAIARNRLAAVDLLYAYRSGMIHISPASTFLRNSYPATVLQNDPSAGVWRNMLTDHAVRQLPFYASFKGQQEEALINKTIDKQFWQSVNQVRVAGAGNTNYAIAKDDVGNWYVKDYGSDPKDIINSAKNLAMFSAGPALGANFLARGAAGTRQPAVPSSLTPPTTQGNAATTGSEGAPATGSGAAPAVSGPQTTLARLHARYAEQYAKETGTARTGLQNDVKTLPETLQAAVAANSQVTPADLTTLKTKKVFVAFDDAALTELAKDSDKNGKPKDAATVNKDIAAVLRALRTYRNATVTRIREANVPTGDTAKVAVDDALRRLIVDRVKERQGSAAVYESAILYIGETAGIQ